MLYIQYLYVYNLGSEGSEGRHIYARRIMRHNITILIWKIAISNIGCMQSVSPRFGDCTLGLCQ